VTIPMALLSILAVTSILGAIWAMAREYQSKRKERQLAEVWARRAFRLRHERKNVDELARMAAFQVRPLSEEERVQFMADWRRTRVKFVEDPERAISEADRLVSMLMYTRGVPAWTLEHDQATILAKSHPEIEQHYRQAHKIAAVANKGAHSANELEQALSSYKVICQRLLAG
jgi:hypothetical protein